MRIAIVRLSALGDIIQSIVVLQFIKKHVPNVSIDWFIQKEHKDILDQAKYLNKVYEIDISSFRGIKFPYKLFQLSRMMNGLEKYDLVIDLQGLIKSAIVTRLIPSKIKVGFDRKSTREKIASNFYNRTFFIDYNTNVILRYVGLVNKSLSLNISSSDIYNKESFFNYRKKEDKQNKYAIFVLGASFDSKIYSIEKYISIANAINIHVFAIWHSKQEKSMADYLAANSKNVSVTEKLSLLELTELIGNANLVIGSDTGPTHLAWALNIPSITLFGCTPMDRNCFTTKKNLAISSDSNVNPSKIDKNDFSVSKIDHNHVILLAKNLLDTK